MTAKIYRFDPTIDKQPHYDAFELDIKAEDCMTVMDLLTYIADNLDGSLSFFSHSACQHGICGRCGVKCNGKPGLACETVLTGEDVTIEPIKADVVKDLVVKN
ncbi:2Fe-2S iron-sulfur cluster-binding protein [Pygmaiobacter massiliensis]|uniref:2Fe-2S iron-sulfur cluster-binding protein n=1 Tax=Pygmaiobacter massiliensis TaxID=1917873 RepID=UPI000C7E23AA|nr:2Fe-2S iron-sulfur cluster-binding protein [Pygmaiobacter massiliensis]